MIKPAGIVAALIAAVVGAVIWGLIAKFSGYEVGYVAWGIGAAIGFASNRLGGGAGVANGALCAALALVAIAGGKVAGSMWTMEDDLAEYYTEEWLSEDSYMTLVAEARVFAKTSDVQYAQFMVDHGYTNETDPKAVSADEIAFFKEGHAQNLRKLAETKPTLEDWRTAEEDGIAESAKEAAKEEAAAATLSDHVSVVKDNLDAMDLLFAGLGIVSAFGLGKGRESDALPQ